MIQLDDWLQAVRPDELETEIALTEALAVTAVSFYEETEMEDWMIEELREISVHIFGFMQGGVSGTKRVFDDDVNKSNMTRRVKSYTNESRKALADSQRGWSPYKKGKQLDRIAEITTSGSDPENSGSSSSNEQMPERTILSASDAPTTRTGRSHNSVFQPRTDGETAFNSKRAK